MTTMPRFGVTELASSQAIPESTVNENLRYVSQGAGHFIFKDRGLATPPGSPADGDCYLVAASGTGAWSGHDGEIAFYMSTAWEFIDPIEGFTAWVNDENVLIAYDGAAWTEVGGGTYGAAEWVPNFSADGEVRIYASEAMTITQQSTSGTGSVAYEKSTNAAPSTFSGTTSPVTLESGAWLKVTASSVSGIYAVALKRTA